MIFYQNKILNMQPQSDPRLYVLIENSKTKTCYQYCKQKYSKQCRQQTSLHLLKCDPSQPQKILKIVGPSTKIQNKTLKSSNGGTMSTNESAEDTVKSQLLFDGYEQGILQQIYGKDSPLYRIPPMEYTQPMFEFRGYMLAKLLLKPQQIKNVIKIYDVFMSGKNTYIIMEYVKTGLNLQNTTNLKKLTFFNLYQYYSDLLNIIDKFSNIYPNKTAKAENIFVYRDFKPLNFILDENRTLKIIDFGHSKLAGQHTTSTRPSTYAYQPYEYLIAEDGDKLNHLNLDLWSITITLYQLMFFVLPQKDINNKQKEKHINWAKELQQQGFKTYKLKMNNYKAQVYPLIFDEIFQNVFVPANQRSIETIKKIITDKDRWQNQIKQFQRKFIKKEMFFKSLYYFYNQIINLLKNAFDHFASNINEKNNFKVRLFLYYLRSLIQYMHLTKYKRYQKNKSKVLQITSEEKCVEILVENKHKIQTIYRSLFCSQHDCSTVNFSNIQQLRKKSEFQISKIIESSSELAMQILKDKQIDKFKKRKEMTQLIQKNKADTDSLQNYYQFLSQKIKISQIFGEEGVDQYLFRFANIQNIKRSEQRNNFEGHIKKFIIKSYEDNSLNQQLIKTQVRRYIDNWFLEKLYKYCTAKNQQEQNESEMKQEIPSMESILQLSQEKMKAEEQDEAGFLGEKWRFSEIWKKCLIYHKTHKI